MSSIAISMLGAGRMGREIMACIARDPGFSLSGLWVRKGSALLDSDLSDYAGVTASVVRPTADLALALQNADVAVDFSLPGASCGVIEAASAAGKPLVCGVSGLDSVARAAMQAAALSIPIFYDRNMSLGVAVLRRLVAEAGRILGTDFAATIHDLHHAGKLDAPSGTALLLGETLAVARGQEFARVMHYADDTAHADGDIVFKVRREGEYPGAHSVNFAGEAESISLSHEVSDRRVFAAGALRAARWLKGQSAGLYNMQDMLADLRAA